MTTTFNAKLEYMLLCDDVRLEAGNKISVMGIFRNIYFYALPSPFLKFVVLCHWVGSGGYTSEVKILSPKRDKVLAATAPAPFRIEPQGFADNVSVFANVVFEEAGTHYLQIYLNAVLLKEETFTVTLLSPPGEGPAPATIQ